jgi:hypothetical protein
LTLDALTLVASSVWVMPPTDWGWEILKSCTPVNPFRSAGVLTALGIAWVRALTAFR